MNARRWFRRPRLAVGLRRRILLIFTVGSFGLSGFLAVTTYGLVRSNLAEQSDGNARASAFRNAQTAWSFLRSDPPTAKAAVEQLQSVGVQEFVINYDDVWSASSGRFGTSAIPAALRARVVDEGVPARMVTTVGGDPVTIVGVPLPNVGAYFEFLSLEEANDTLENVGLSLALAAMITTGLGILLGAFAARRSIRPLADTAHAAQAIAGGELSTRLADSDDPDLLSLTTAFNDMASALEQRIERDARFASDVSHELRSPLMTLSASVEVMEARRCDLPPRAAEALDLLSGDVARFQGLVDDLLEISRFDAGAIRLNLEDLLAAEFVHNSVRHSQAPDLEVTTTGRAAEAVIRGDRRRLARAIGNLIDNAIAYAGGAPEVSIHDASPAGEPLSHIRIVVEDHGPGVPAAERNLVFDRFSRGASAGRRTGSEGAGLGLSLVDEHVRMHGGRVWVEDRTDGESGARFVIELPASELEGEGEM